MQSLSAELAIQNLTEEIIQSLEETNEAFAVAIQQQETFKALKIDELFHQIIGDAANNSYITSMVSNLQAHVRRLFFHNSIVLTESSIQEHKDIIQFLKAHDGKAASELMRTNWLRAIDEFKSLKN